QLHERPRPGCGHLRQGESRGYFAADAHRWLDGLHVRNAQHPAAHTLRAEEPAAAEGLRWRVAGPEAKFHAGGTLPAACATAARVVNAMAAINATHDRGVKSGVAAANAPHADFPIQNLLFACFRRAGTGEDFRGG